MIALYSIGVVGCSRLSLVRIEKRRITEYQHYDGKYYAITSTPVCLHNETNGKIRQRANFSMPLIPSQIILVVSG